MLGSGFDEEDMGSNAEVRRGERKRMWAEKLGVRMTRSANTRGRSEGDLAADGEVIHHPLTAAKVKGLACRR
jgi:hypothetical protein